MIPISPQQQKNRRTILLLFSMTLIPFCIAAYLATMPPRKTTNHGELIIPIIPTEKTDFYGFDAFSRENMHELSGHWLIVNVIPQRDCALICLEALHKSKQLHLMLSKDLTRVRRLVLLLDPNSPETAAHWWTDDSRLLRATVSPSLKNRLQQLKSGQIPEGMLLLIDPLGNLMMQYAPGFNPYDVVQDLKKLLTVSQIG
jgi:hypothetical protein